MKWLQQPGTGSHSAPVHGCPCYIFTPRSCECVGKSTPCATLFCPILGCSTDSCDSRSCFIYF